MYAQLLLSQQVAGVQGNSLRLSVYLSLELVEASHTANCLRFLGEVAPLVPATTCGLSKFLAPAPLGCFSWTTLLLALAYATEGRLSLRSREAVCSACPKKTLVELLGAILTGMDFLRAPGAEILRSRWQQEVSCAESTCALGLYIVCSGCAHRDLESLVPIVRAKSRWRLA